MNLSSVKGKVSGGRNTHHFTRDYSRAKEVRTQHLQERVLLVSLHFSNWSYPSILSCNYYLPCNSSHSGNNYCWCPVTVSLSREVVTQTNKDRYYRKYPNTQTWCEQGAMEEYPALALESRRSRQTQTKVEPEEEEEIHVTWEETGSGIRISGGWSQLQHEDERRVQEKLAQAVWRQEWISPVRERSHS